MSWRDRWVHPGSTENTSPNQSTSSPSSCSLGGVRDQQQHSVAWLEFLGLGQLIIDPVLGRLSFQHVLLDDGGNFVDPFLHFLNIFHYYLERGGLFLQEFMGHVEQTPGSSSEEELEGGESSGGLRCLSDNEQDVGEQVSIPPILFHHPLEHPLQGMVESLNEPINLMVVY